MDETLEIPDAAWMAYHKERIAGDGLKAAAPLIVAAELRRLGHAVHPLAIITTNSLITRANELDPQQ